MINNQDDLINRIMTCDSGCVMYTQKLHWLMSTSPHTYEYADNLGTQCGVVDYVILPFHDDKSIVTSYDTYLECLTQQLLDHAH